MSDDARTDDEPVRTWDDVLDEIPAHLRRDADVLVQWVAVGGGEPVHALSRLLHALGRYRAAGDELAAVARRYAALGRSADNGLLLDKVTAWRAVRGDAATDVEPAWPSDDDQPCTACGEMVSCTSAHQVIVRQWEQHDPPGEIQTIGWSTVVGVYHGRCAPQRGEAARVAAWADDNAPAGTAAAEAACESARTWLLDVVQGSSDGVADTATLAELVGRVSGLLNRAERAAPAAVPTDGQAPASWVDNPDQVRGALGWLLYVAEHGDDETGQDAAAREAVGDKNYTTLQRLLDRPAPAPADDTAAPDDVDAWVITGSADVAPATLCGKYVTPGWRCVLTLGDDLVCAKHGRRQVPPSSSSTGTDTQPTTEPEEG